MAPRITYKRRHAYNTLSNKIMKKRLPGGALGIAYVKKTTKGAQPASGDAGRIHGVRRARREEMRRIISFVMFDRAIERRERARGTWSRAMHRA